MKAYQSTLSVLLNPSGGIIDDTVVTKHSDEAYYVVTNAGRRDVDLPWFKEKLAEWNNGLGKEWVEKMGVGEWKGEVEMEEMEGWGLVALQGLLAT
jgi:aminomethyltransferase